jgi:hypothetical protein
MFELVAVNRLKVREQVSLRRFNEHAEAVEKAERRRQSEPLRYFVVFIWVSDFCRLVCHHTL